MNYSRTRILTVAFLAATLLALAPFLMLGGEEIRRETASAFGSFTEVLLR